MSRRPNTEAQEAQVELSFGQDDRSHAAVDLTGPLNEDWAYRFDVSYNQADNWVDRGDSDSLAIAGTLQWDVSDTLRLSLSYDYGDQNPIEYFGTPLIDGRLDESLRHQNYNVRDSRSTIATRGRASRRSGRRARTCRSTTRSTGSTSTASGATSRSTSWNSDTGEIDRFSYIGILHHQEQIGDTADARIEHELFGRENHVVSGSTSTACASRTSTTSATTQFDATTSVPLRNFDPGVFIDLDPTIPRFRTETDQYSLFFEDRFVIDERWSLIAGARYDNAELDRFNLVNPAASFDASFSNTSWRVGVVFQPVQTLSFYGQYSTAVDPIGSLITTSAIGAAST